MKESRKIRGETQANNKLFGIIVSLLLVLGLFGLLQVWQNKETHEESARNYITDTLIPELSLWKTRYWYNHLSPEARKKITAKDLRDTLKQYARLGTLQSHQSPIFSNRAKHENISPGQLYNYIVHTRYNNDSAVLQLTLRQAEKRLYLEKINIISVVFDKNRTERIEIRLPKKMAAKKVQPI